MVTKGFKDLMAEANAAIEVVSAQDAAALLGRDDVVFIDVREAHERAKGTIPTSVHAPRGIGLGQPRRLRSQGGQRGTRRRAALRGNRQRLHHP